MTKEESTKATTIQDLPWEILLRIFMFLDIVNLVNGASKVCTMWRSVCRNPVLWNKIDLNKIDSDITPASGETRSVKWRDLENFSLSSMMILKKALNLGSGTVKTLVFHYSMLVKGDYLLVAAKRSPNLRRLVLSSYLELSETGYDELFKHWEHLQSITLPVPYLHFNMMKDIGIYCSKLVELKLILPLDSNLANMLVMHIPQIKILSLRWTAIYRGPLVHMLKSITSLEVLDFSHSNLIDDYEDEEDADMINLGNIEAALNPLLLRLKKFITCGNFTTDWCVCDYVDEEFKQWFKNNEEKPLLEI